MINKNKKNPFSIQEGRFSFGKLKDSFYLTAWTEHAFLSKDDHKEHIGATFNFKQIKIIKIIIFIFFSFLITRVAWLQVYNSSHYQLMAESNKVRRELIGANRGIIYDRNNKALVKNQANFVLSIRVKDLPQDTLVRDSIIRKISYLIDFNQEFSEDNYIDGPSFMLIKDKVDSISYGSLESYQPLFILENLDYQTALKLILKKDEFPGFIITEKIKRNYLPLLQNNVYSLSHILGYTGKISETELVIRKNNYSIIDYIGKNGLEAVWEEALRGENGYLSYEVNALGQKIKIINEQSPIHGNNLHLSLDLELQIKVEEVLNKWLEIRDLDKAVVVILNPQNGEILSLVSLPAFDNNDFAGGISHEKYQNLINDPNLPLFNRAIAGEYPSGSTIKPLISAAALEENIIDENSTFLSTGGLRIGQWFFPDWRPGGHGRVDLKQALAQSVNTFYYYIGGGYQDFTGLGLENLVHYSKLFGLGEISGIDLNGEARGLVPDRDWKREKIGETWYIGDTYHFSIGQGYLLATPLQITNYIAAIANGGKLFQPHFVKEIRNEKNNLIEEIKPQIIRQNFINESNLKIVQAGMRQAVSSGSAIRLNNLPVEVAGKTGTAQWSSQKDNHAWFVGFAPYRNPEIAFTILVEEGVEGSDIAVSIAKDILDWYFEQN